MAGTHWVVGWVGLLVCHSVPFVAADLASLGDPSRWDNAAVVGAACSDWWTLGNCLGSVEGGSYWVDNPRLLVGHWAASFLGSPASLFLDAASMGASKKVGGGAFVGAAPFLVSSGVVELVVGQALGTGHSWLGGSALGNRTAFEAVVNTEGAVGAEGDDSGS